MLHRCHRRVLSQQHGIFGSGCFELTAAGCAATAGTYFGDASSCDGRICLQSNGASCTDPAACNSGFCVEGTCCDTACTGPLERCNLAGQVGMCASAAAEAPTLTPWGLLVAGVLLTGIAAFSLRYRMRGP